MTPRFFIAGATGYTGRELVRLSAAQGIDTWAHVRPESAKHAEWSQQFTTWGATPTSVPWKPAALKEAFHKAPPSHIFAVLGTTKARTKKERRRGLAVTGYEAVDYGLTKMAYDAATELATPPIFVYLSSLGVDAARRNAYLDARYRIEQRLKNGPLPYVIFRPSFISGPDRDEFRPLERVGAVATDALFSGLAGIGLRGPKNRWGSINNTDLARAMIDSALDPTAKNTTLSAQDIRSSTA